MRAEARRRWEGQADRVQTPRLRPQADAALALYRLRGELLANWHLWEPDQRREQHRERGGQEDGSARGECAGGRGNAQCARYAPIRLGPTYVSSLSFLMKLLHATCERNSAARAAWEIVSSRLSASAARKRLERPGSCPPGKAGAHGIGRSSAVELARAGLPACSTRSRARRLRCPHPSTPPQFLGDRADE